MTLEAKYNHLAVENDKYQNWIEKGYFTAGDLSKRPYCIVIPPPNVTGKLHLGHAWDTTLQDILCRYKRLKGYDVCWVAGMDHAGIATQAKVDARLKSEGISRYDIGREKFLERAWEWKEEYASTIRSQWAKLGLSLDYSRERFTLDEGLSHAVRKVFVDLYNDGLIYQGERIINWDPEAKTALSNIEVEHKEIKGHMYYFKYKVVETGKELVIALNGAIDHTQTYSQSVNLANSTYYCLYDIEDFNNAKYYPSPSELISTDHYLKAYKYGLGNAWPVSQFGPAFFVFRPEGTTLQAFVDDASTTNLYGGSASQPRKKVPAEWVVDGIEVFVQGADGNQKRLLPSVDAGYVELTRGMGYTLYRNVDKEATEALAENEGKLVYNYSLGVGNSTDASGIDAEASLKNGARIIFQDTNNSTADFHQRSKSSLRN